MAVAVRDLRLTFLWTETRVDLLREPVPDVPLSDLGRSATYAARFDALRRTGHDPDGLLPPWPPQTGNRFWQYYLEGQPPTQVNGSYAWKHLVPLRWPLPENLGAAWLPGWGALDGFVFPFGITLAATVRIDIRPPAAALPLFEAVALAHRVRNDHLTRTSIDGGALPEAGLARIAEDGLDRLRSMIYGHDAELGVRAATPFTLATFVKAEGVAAADPTPEQGDVHRALEALTTWRPTWRDDVLPALAGNASDIKRGPPNRVVYTRRRGRAVWFPEPASSGDSTLRSLGRYHRNQMYAALQVESLGEFLRCTADRRDRGEVLSPVEERCAKLAAGILGRLYGGDRLTYRSGGCRAQIDRDGLAAPINAVRSSYLMPPLA